jgi:hypothetical protein
MSVTIIALALQDLHRRIHPSFSTPQQSSLQLVGMYHQAFLHPPRRRLRHQALHRRWFCKISTALNMLPIASS